MFQPTSDVLPPDEFPQFASQGVAEYVDAGATRSRRSRATGTPARVHADDCYMRLTRTST